MPKPKKIASKKRSGLPRSAGKLMDAARGPINAMRVALKKMFGPLTPAERRELTAAAKRLGRDLDKLVQVLAKPRKRARAVRSSRKGKSS